MFWLSQAKFRPILFNNELKNIVQLELLIPVIMLIQYFKILILLVICNGNRPNSPHIKELAVLRLTCTILLQNERCTRSTSRAL